MKPLVLALLLTPGLLHAAPFTDNGDQTVTDQKTGLVWQQASSASTMNWSNGLSTCEGLTLANQSDWRLPNVKELRTLIDNTKSVPAIDTVAFPNTQSSYYWTSTVYAPVTTFAWGVSFGLGLGGVGSYVQTNTYYVRCVR